VDFAYSTARSAICAAAALTAVLTLPATSYAYQGSTTPKLHVSGRYLQDTCDENVLLHGWMQPTASWFNGEGNRYTDPSNWNDPANVAGMLNFMRDAATVMSDTSPKYGEAHGWYATFVRVNTDGVGGWTSEQGLVDPSQFDAWIDNFLVPYADHLRSRGLYLVLCATGPMVVNAGGDGNRNMGQGTQQRMLSFWQTVANAPGIKSTDNVMFELMNEPVAIETSFGANDWGFGSAPYWQALRNWMQPVVDAIRNTGADNVIWVPTLGWQGEPHGWAQYPISGDNVGIAAHFYPGYGGVHDDATAVQNLWNSNYKPAADLKPMIITEMMWYPNAPGGYDDLFNGATAGFGNAVKSAIDNQGNVSFLVGFLADHLVNLVTTPPASCTLGTHEGSQAYFEWLPTYTSAAPTICGAGGASTDAGAPDASSNDAAADTGGVGGATGGSATGGGSGTGAAVGGTGGVAASTGGSGGAKAASSAGDDTSGCACRNSGGRSNGEASVFLLFAAALFRRRRAAKTTVASRRPEIAVRE
jgi:hypothetical protein